MEMKFFGHATVLLSAPSLKILTDPWFFDPIYLFGRHHPVVPNRIETLPEIDIILITHHHTDHAQDKSLLYLRDRFPDVLLVYPLYADRYFKKFKFSKTAPLKWDERLSISSNSITACYAKHRVPENTYILEFSDGTVSYFGGDTMLFDGMEELGKRFSIDIALLPISGTVSMGIGQETMNSFEAGVAATRLNAREIIPIHYNFRFNVPLLGDSFLVKTQNGTTGFERIMKKHFPSLKYRVLEIEM